MILRNFADERGQLFFWRRGFPTGVVKRTAPGNLFVEADLYSVVGDDGFRDDTVEDDLAELESVGADFIRQVLGIVRRGGLPALTDDAWSFWARFMYAHMRRAPKYLNHAGDESAWEAIRESLRRSVADDRPEGELARMLLDDPVALRRYEKNFLVRSLSKGPSASMSKLFEERGISVMVAPPGKSFIVGEVGFVKARWRSPYSATGWVAFTPMAPDVALGFGTQYRRIGVIVVAPETVRSMNEAMMAQSTVVASASENLLKSLSRVDRSRAA